MNSSIIPPLAYTERSRRRGWPYEEWLNGTQPGVPASSPTQHRGVPVKRYQFSIQEITDPENPGEMTTGIGSEKVVAQLMRAAADEIDPPKEDPAYEIGKTWGENIMNQFLGNAGKKPPQ
jgi:hypothetical protein